MIPEGDMSGLLAQAQAMQQQLFQAQQELAETEIQGTAGGDLVTATITGADPPRWIGRSSTAGAVAVAAGSGAMVRVRAAVSICAAGT